MGLRTTFYLILRPVRELERARTSLFVWFDRPDGRTGDYTTSSIRENIISFFNKELNFYSIHYAHTY